MGSKKMLTPQEVATEMGVAYTTVMLWLKQGRLRGARQKQEARGPVWEIPAAALKGFEKPKQGRPRKLEAA